MAIAALVLWLLTAGAGFYLLVTSNLGRARPAATGPAAEPAPAAMQATPAAMPLRRHPPLRRRPPRPPRSGRPPRKPQGRRPPRSVRCGGRRGTGSIRPR